MDEIERKRNQLRQVYRTTTWQTKVDKMSDGQVIAVWKRFQFEDLFRNPPHNR